VGDYQIYRSQKFSKFVYILLLEYLIIRTMEIEHYHSGMIKPEVAIEALKKHGIIVSEKQAKEIIETMFFLVNLSIDQIVGPAKVEDSE
jgi:hypothetical protein